MSRSGQNPGTAAKTVEIAGSEVSGSLPLVVHLYLMSVMLPIFFRAGPLTMTGTRLVLIIVVIPLLVKLFSGAFGRVIATDWLLVLSFLWSFIALIINNPEQAVQNAGSSGIEFLGGYVLGRAHIRDRGTFIALIKALVLWIVLLLPFTIYEAMTGVPLIPNTIRKIPGLGSVTDTRTDVRMGMYRAQLVFAHPIHLGLFCSLVLSPCFIGLKGVWGNMRRVILAGVVAMSGLFALSSGGILAILLQFGLWTWAFIFRNNKKRWLIMVGMFAAMYIAIDILSNRSPIMVFLSYATFSPQTAYYRTIIFDWGMVNIWQHPIFGIGLNDWVRPFWMHSASVDNFWLLTAMRYGIPGFVFVTVGYLLALWKVGMRKFDSDIGLWRLRRAWMFAFIGLTFTLCTVHVWHTVYSFTFFMLGAGMWFITATPLDPDAQAEEEPSQARPAQSFSRGALQSVGRHKASINPAPRKVKKYTRF